MEGNLTYELKQNEEIAKLKSDSVALRGKQAASEKEKQKAGEEIAELNGKIAAEARKMKEVDRLRARIERATNEKRELDEAPILVAEEAEIIRRPQEDGGELEGRGGAERRPAGRAGRAEERPVRRAPGGVRRRRRPPLGWRSSGG